MYRYKTTGKVVTDKEYIRSIVNEVLEDFDNFDITEDYGIFIHSIKRYQEMEQDAEYMKELK